MYVVPLLACRQIVAQCQSRNCVIAAVLPIIGDRFGHKQIIQTLAQLCTQSCKARTVGAAGAIKRERRQDVKTGIKQDAMLNGEQNVIDMAIDAAWAVVGLPSAHRDNQRSGYRVTVNLSGGRCKKIKKSRLVRAGISYLKRELVYSITSIMIFLFRLLAG